MIQLQVLSGKLAGSSIAVRQFPFVVGRGAGDDFQLEAEGVWESHFHIDFTPAEGFTAKRLAQAMLLANGEPVDCIRLKNGDVLAAGAAQIRFWLAATRQKTMRVREVLTWAALVALFAAQIALIYRLL